MVEDGIEGYQDIGEEEDWTAEQDGDAEGPSKGLQRDKNKEDPHKGLHQIQLACCPKVCLLVIGLTVENGGFGYEHSEKSAAPWTDSANQSNKLLSILIIPRSCC